MTHPGHHLWDVKITFTDGVYQCDAWSATATGALHLVMTDARSVETLPWLTGAVREVHITMKEET